MSQDRPTPPPPSRPGRSEPWRVERMVQRVPAHLGETTADTVSPWVMVAGIGLLVLVVCIVLFIVLGGGTRLGLGGASTTATPTRGARTVSPAVTIMPVTAVPALTATPAATVAIVKYKVKAGDSLLEIAAKYKVTLQAIMSANNLKDANSIRVGDELIIPLPTPTPPPGANPSPPPITTPTPLSFQSPPTSALSAATPGVIYVVKRGDTLIGIAGQFGSTVDAIRIANQLDSDSLAIGQRLVIPPGDWTPTPTLAPVANATATATAQYAYAAPSLLAPAEGKQFRGSQDAPQLMWVSPATLKSNEFYVVHVEYGEGAEKKALPSLTVKQGTSVKLDSATYYPGANPNGTKFSWYVLVVSQGTTQRTAASPSSPTWTFVWY